MMLRRSRGENKRELSKVDIPFERKILTREEAFRTFFPIIIMRRSEGDLKKHASCGKVPVYSCDGFLNFFYGQMVPSTGYVEYFELREV